MRKQTKVVAVASAAALLAIGASMTSFAATGWVEEDGTWYFYDNDGNRVEDEWKKSGDNWYWLDAEDGGAMATEKIVEDDDDIYYVDANGVMVRNTWIKVVNEEQDEDDDPAEYHYYYLQSNGKAYKAPETGTTRFRTIDGKKYAFDDEGVMLYGWVNESSERATDEDDWANEDYKYYLGTWEEGDMKTGWQKILVHDDLEDDDKEHWFHFRANGKKRFNDEPGSSDIKQETINGKKYGFDNRGVMVSQWTMVASSSIEASAASSSNWRYFRSPEDGARLSKGWFKVIAPDEDNDNVFTSNYGSYSFAKGDADDENERWYWADGDGIIKEGVIYKIKGKYYGFRPEGDGTEKGGAMLSGLVMMSVNNQGEITKVYDDGVDSDELDDLIDGEIPNDDYLGIKSDPNATLYYFGNDEDSDGAMKTGATTVTLDGKTYHFFFSKTGGAENRGKGLTGIDDSKYIYKYGCRIEADKDDKYQVVEVKPAKAGDPIDLQAKGVKVNKVKSSSLRQPSTSTYVDKTKSGTTTNTNNDTVTYATLNDDLYLVNTGGNIQTNKAAAKDGNDWYFYSKDGKVKFYASDKNLKEHKDIATKRTDWKEYAGIK